MLMAGLPSADKLISEIREMHNRRGINASKLTCEMIEQKIARRELVRSGTMKKKHYEYVATKANFTKSLRPPFHNPLETDTKIKTAGHREKKRTSDKTIDSPKGNGEPSIPTAEECCVNTCCAIDRSRASPGSYSTWTARTTTPLCLAVLPEIFNATGNHISQIIGEIVFQLEKRIILHVFPDAHRVYYGTLKDIRRVIWSEPDEQLQRTSTLALERCIQRLQRLGWDIDYHVDFGHQIMEKYGVGAPAFLYDKRDTLGTHAQLARLIAKKLPLTERIGMMTVLSGLLSLAMEDKRPLFLTTKGEELVFA